MFKGTMTKWPVQKTNKGTTQKLLQHHDRANAITHFVFLNPLNAKQFKLNLLLS